MMKSRSPRHIGNAVPLLDDSQPDGDDLVSRLCDALYAICDCEALSRTNDNEKLEQSLASIRKAIVECLNEPELKPVNVRTAKH